MRGRKEGGPTRSGGGKEKAGVEEGETVIKIYCMVKESIFSK